MSTATESGATVRGRASKAVLARMANPWREQLLSASRGEGYPRAGTWARAWASRFEVEIDVDADADGQHSEIAGRYHTCGMMGQVGRGPLRSRRRASSYPSGLRFPRLRMVWSRLPVGFCCKSDSDCKRVIFTAIHKAFFFLELHAMNCLPLYFLIAITVCGFHNFL